MPEKSLPEFAATFDRASLQPMLAEAEQQRQMLLARFPREDLAALSLERYATDRDNPDTLANLLAIGTPTLGSVQSVAFRVAGIHRLKGTRLFKSSLENAGDAADDWLRLRTALVQCCEMAAQGQWDAVDKVSVSNWIPAIRTKLLHVYFPDEVLPIYVSGEMGHFLDALKIGFSPGNGKWAAAPNRKLLEHLRTVPELVGWNTLELATLLRAWFPKPKNTTADEVILKIAPGENAEYWDECLVSSIICIGWDDVGDLRDFQTEEDLKKSFNASYTQENDSSGKRAFRSRTVAHLWRVRNLQPGDRIVANRGMSEVLALGTVIEPGYEWSDAREKFKHTVHVDWDTSFARRMPENQSEWRPTITILSSEHKRLIFSPTPAPPSNLNNTMTHPALNHILYGPPGTGKTHRVIREAAAIIEGRTPASAEAKLAYDKACSDGRVRLVTFHQSFSYEDFIEGIRPKMDETGAARFEVRDGLFKEIATEALFACLELIPSGDSDPATSSAGRRPSAGTRTGRVWDIADEIRKNSDGSKSIRGQIVQAATQEGINFNTATTQYSHWRRAQRDPDLSSASPVNHVPEIPSREIALSYLQDGPASGWQLRTDKNFPPYVLVIDEINRGNISRIFGELITLIEEDKREGAENALRVTLPSSRELFAVPPNLYILGTMNTADKSLALLDVALRRRFEFEELAPDFSVCSDLPEEMKAVLNRLNNRIELRKDRDHRIGHAFFMGVQNAEGFNRVFRRKVVPLLQEYFFNDIDGARFVLGEENQSGEKGFLRPLKAKVESKYQRNRWRWFTDEEPGMDCWAVLNANLANS